MAKRAAASSPKIAEDADDVNQEVSETDESEDATNDGMSKMDMVVEALENGCPTAKTGIPYLDKKHPGHGISASYFGICKSNHLKKHDGETTSTTSSEHSHPTAAVRDLPATFGRDMMKIKELIETAGSADELKDLFNTVGDLQHRYGLKNINQMIDALS